MDSTNSSSVVMHQAPFEAGAKYDRELLTFNGRIFRLMYQAQRNGFNCLPYFLGVSEAEQPEFIRFLNDSDPSLDVNFTSQSWEDTRQTLLDMRRDEWQEVCNLLLEYARPLQNSSRWMAEIVAAGCLGGNHLWRDLGLPNRQLLSDLLAENFPELAALNTKNMKWKKFFYKQLCEAEGGYVCRAPTCEQCTAYDECFNS